MQNYIEKFKIISDIPAMPIGRQAAAGIHSLSAWDIWFLLIAAAAAVIYAFLFVSRGRVVPVLVSTYLSYVLVKAAPFLDMKFAKAVNLHEVYALNLLAFGIVFVLLFFVLSRVIFLSPVGSETFGIISSLILAVIQIGFLAAALGSFLPAAVGREFSLPVRQVFLGTAAFFYWAAASVGFLLYVGFKTNRRV